MASSIRIPTERESPSIVILLKVNQKTFIIAKVEIIEVGIAIALIIVTLILLKNNNTAIEAKNPPYKRWNCTSSIDLLIKCDWSKLISSFIPAGRDFLIFSISFFILSVTSSVFVPDCFWIPRPIEGTLLNLVTERFSAIPSSALPTSFNLIAVP